MKTATVLIAHAIVDISAAARNSAVMLTSVVESALAASHMLKSPSEMKPLKTARITANDKNAFHPDERSDQRSGPTMRDRDQHVHMVTIDRSGIDASHSLYFVHCAFVFL